MKINVIHCIDWREIAEKFNWTEEDVNFLLNMNVNSYIEFNLDTNAITELEDSLEHAIAYCYDQAIKCYQNEIKLIKYLNTLGYRDKILIRYNWW